RPAHRQAHRFRRWCARNGRARATGRLRQSGRRVLALSCEHCRAHGSLRRWRDHAAEIDMVRTQTAGWVIDTCHLTVLGPWFLVLGPSLVLGVPGPWCAPRTKYEGQTKDKGRTKD